MHTQTGVFIERSETITPPTLEQLDQVSRDMLSRYPHVRWDRNKLDDKIWCAIENLKNRASPGYPYMRWAGTNAELISTLGKPWLFSMVKERLLRVARAPPEAFSEWSAARRVASGLCDPIRVFVKNELHSKKKVEAGRWRTIWSVSVVDQLVERVLNSNLNQTEIGMWSDIPSKPGMGLSDEDLKKLAENFTRMIRPAGTDISGWDMSILQWAIDWDADMRAAAQGFDPGDNMWKRRCRLQGLSLLVFSDGYMAEQLKEHPGLIKSGGYCTSSSGSRIRVMKRKLATGDVSGEVGAMGDDCYEDLPEGWTKDDLVEAYGKVGLHLKVVESFEHDGYLEFCSYRFGREGSLQPCSWQKKTLTFAKNWPAASEFEGRKDELEHELRHSPDRDFALEVIMQLHNFVSGSGGPRKQ